MNEQKLLRYMHDLSHIRGFEEQARDIDEIQNVINHYNRDSAKQVCSHYSYKYESMINRVGEYYNDAHVLTNTDLYYTKTEEDMMDNLIFIRNVIVIYMSVRARLYDSIESAVNDLLL